MPVTFLSPWYLLFSLAIAVPVIIHLIQRRREVILPYSMVRFVLVAKKRSARRLKLRRLLLLLARVAAVLLLTLLLARPVLTSPASSLYGGKAGRTVVIVDNSLSMDAGRGKGNRFAVLRSRAEALVSSAPEGELFSLVAAAAMGNGPGQGSWTEREGFLPALGGLRVQPHRGDMTRAFERAYDLLREERRGPGRIVVFSDLARGSWSDFSVLSLRSADPSIPVTLFRVGSERDVRGAGIVELRVEGKERVEGGRVALRGRIVNHGPETTLTVALRVDGSEHDRKVVDIPPGGEGTASFVLDGLKAGGHRVEMFLAKDWFPPDDRRLVGVRLRPPVKVLLVDGDPRFTLVESESFFLREALRSDRLSAGRPVETRVVDAESLAETDLRGFDVVVLANVPAPPPETRLTEYVDGGGGLVVFWGDNCRPREYADNLGSVLPVRTGETVSSDPEAPFRIGDVDFEDGILGIFRPPDGGSFATASFYRRAGVTAELEGGTVAARFEDGSPWMVRGRTGAGEVVFFASTADIGWNDLPTKPVFVPLLRRVVMELAGQLDAAKDAGIEAGETKVFTGGSELAYSAMRVVAPDGAASSLEFRPREGKAETRFDETERVGFYSYSGEEGEGFFAVNTPSAESDLQPLAEEEIRGRFQQVPLELYGPAQERSQAALVQGGARSLTRQLLLVLFLLLVAEMAIAGPRMQFRRG